MRGGIYDAEMQHGCQPQDTDVSCSECHSKEAVYACADKGCRGHEGFCEECAPRGVLVAGMCPCCGRLLLEL